MNRISRIEHALAFLTRAYWTRKTKGRPYVHLLPRCRRLSAAWLEERHQQLNHPPE